MITKQMVLDNDQILNSKSYNSFSIRWLKRLRIVMRININFGISRLGIIGMSMNLTAGNASIVVPVIFCPIKCYLYIGFCNLFICSSCMLKLACNQRTQHEKTNSCFFLL